MNSPKNPDPHQDLFTRAALPHSESGPDFGEDTLRILAALPPPEGMVDRVQARLQTAPRFSTRFGGILPWPVSFAPAWGYGGMARSAAAAAIVCLVAGGGWQIYSHVQTGPSAQILVMPAPSGPARGFSIGGSVHTPDPVRTPAPARPLNSSPAISRPIISKPALSGPASPQPIETGLMATDSQGNQGNQDKRSKQSGQRKAAKPSSARPQQP
jgi:hypothetical protein